MTTPIGDTGVASVARMYDYYLGGKDNYAVDRQAAEGVLAKAPWVRPLARHNRHFLARAVRHCVRSGIRQVIDIGTGFPTSPNPWEVAWDVDPRTCVIGVDYDETVLAHARAHAHQATVIEGDLRDPDAVLAGLEPLVDWSQPVALALVAVLHFLTGQDDPAGCVRAFRTKMAPGSRLVVSHIARDGTPADVVESIEREYRENAAAPLVFRTTEQILDLFEGFELEEPGWCRSRIGVPTRSSPPSFPSSAVTPRRHGCGAWEQSVCWRRHDPVRRTRRPARLVPGFRSADRVAVHRPQ